MAGPIRHACCDASLRRLGVDVIDLYYQHRLTRRCPSRNRRGDERTGFAPARCISSDFPKRRPRPSARDENASHQRFADGIFAVDARRGAKILPLCRELGIGFVPYSPLGRGFLTANSRSSMTSRRATGVELATVQEGNFERNLELAKRIEALAQRKKCTAAQLALAWVLAQGDDIVPIPAPSGGNMLWKTRRC